MPLRFVIIEDNAGIRRMLNNIINEHNLGIVLDECDNGIDGERLLKQYQPDIALVDLLLPLQDGLQTINNAANAGIESSVIMISKSNTEEFITEAYRSGIEFFIHKPVNVSELTSIINTIKEKRHLKQLMAAINKTTAKYSDTQPSTQKSSHFCQQEKLNKLFSDLGLLSDIGIKDISKLIYMIENNLPHSTKGSYQLLELYKKLALSQNDDANTIKQRVRRTVSKAMNHIASLGADDYYNDNFQIYSSTLFDFKEVRVEIEYINRKRQQRGKVNVKKFIEGLIFLSSTPNN